MPGRHTAPPIMPEKESVQVKYGILKSPTTRMIVVVIGLAVIAGALFFIL